MKLGVPVIARNNIRHASIIKHQSTGLLFTISEVRTRYAVSRIKGALKMQDLKFMTDKEK